MRRVLAFLFNRTTLVLLGLVALALVIWFVGPLIAVATWVPLESALPRIILIALIFLGWAIARVVRWWRARQENAQLLKEIAKDDGKGAPGRTIGAEEVAKLRQRFDMAVETLRKSHVEGRGSGLFALFGRRRYVYQMPWYMFIGAPGSGKTTALVSSGLEFPLAKEFGKEAIRGVGGTRDCDWWFTNEAVLLDTAGRYTTQESNEALDRAEWTGFLTLLRKYRRRAPINGVLLTISVQDLLGSDDSERERHAAAIRRRLAELDDTLKIRFPLYILVTKVDLLAGFNEYFGNLTKEDRAQVWGFTLPLEQSEATTTDVAAASRSEFALLQKRIEDALPDVLQGEVDVQRRAMIYAFPQEFAGLREVLDRFLQSLFVPSKFAAPPLARGVYLTSGTQEGTPFDRVLGALERQFGVAAAIQTATSAQGTGRSYFLRTLLQKVVFAESHLVERNPARDRRRRIVQATGIAASVVLLAVASLAWVVSYSNNRAYLAEIGARARALATQVKASPNTTTDDLATLLPILDEAASLAASEKFALESPPLAYRFGLYQGRNVEAVAAGAYDRLLDDLLLPRVVLRIKRLLSEAPDDNMEALYGRLKAYSMLYDAEHYQARYLLSAVAADWQANEASGMPPESQRALLGHLNHLFGDRVRTPSSPIDEAVVGGARARLAQYTHAQRLYAQIKAITADKVRGQLPDFTLVTAAGPEAKLAFVRISGKSLDEGVPALYTRDGYKAMSAVLLDRRLLLQLDEPWVLGRSATPAVAKAAELLDDRLVAEIRRYYLEEYRVAWDKFLADLRLVAVPDITASVALARTLSAPDSPLLKMIRAVATETTLSETGKQSAGVSERAADAVKEATTSAASRVFGSSSLTRRDAADESVRAGRIEKQYVDDYFEQWRRLAGSPQQGGGGEALRQLLNQLYTDLSAAESAMRMGNPPPNTDTGVKLRAEAARLPVPLRGMFEGLSATTLTQAASATRASVGAQLDASIGDFCRKAIAGRYPFVRTSARDVAPDDFARLFAPGGMMDDFFQKNLASIVDTTTRPWTFRRNVDGSPGGSSASLIAFERAQVIRDVFFRGGGRIPQFRIDVKPVEMDAAIIAFTLDADGTTILYSHGPPERRSIIWPGPAGRNQVRVTLNVPPASPGATFEGPWALHRLFDRADITPGPSPERFTATFNFESRQVALEVIAASVQNPLTLRELKEFSCPSR